MGVGTSSTISEMMYVSLSQSNSSQNTNADVKHQNHSTFPRNRISRTILNVLYDVLMKKAGVWRQVRKLSLIGEGSTHEIWKNDLSG
jgi:hypothetical protein